MESTRLQKIERLLQKELSDILREADARNAWRIGLCQRSSCKSGFKCGESLFKHFTIRIIARAIGGYTEQYESDPF